MLPPSTLTFAKVPTPETADEPNPVKVEPIQGIATLEGVDGEGNPIWSPGIRNPSQVDQSSAEDGPPSRLEFEALKTRVASLERLVEILDGRWWAKFPEEEAYARK